MTSSLVGSEMCIRDRLKYQSMEILIHALMIKVLRNPSQGHPWLMKGPVSYTHLTLPTICSV
eukprot:9269528-Prorocentrum_lima.AAC.1